MGKTSLSWVSTLLCEYTFVCVCIKCIICLSKLPCLTSKICLLVLNTVFNFGHAQGDVTSFFSVIVDLHTNVTLRPFSIEYVLE